MSRKFSFKEGGPEPSRPGKPSFKVREPEKFSFKELVPPEDVPPGKFSFKQNRAPPEREPSQDLGDIPAPDNDHSYAELSDVIRERPPKPLKLSQYKKTGIFLTVNTNRLMTPENYQALDVAMRKITRGEIDPVRFGEMFSNGANGRPLLVPGNRRPIKSTYALEGYRGKERLHSHGLIAIQYLRETPNGEQKLFFHLDKFREILLEEYRLAGGGVGLDNPIPYINFRIGGLSETDAYIYIHKEDGSTAKVPPTPENLKIWHEQNTQRKPKRYKPADLSAKAASKYARRHKAKSK